MIKSACLLVIKLTITLFMQVPPKISQEQATKQLPSISISPCSKRSEHTLGMSFEI